MLLNLCCPLCLCVHTSTPWSRTNWLIEKQKVGSLSCSLTHTLTHKACVGRSKWKLWKYECSENTDSREVDYPAGVVWEVFLDVSPPKMTNFRNHGYWSKLNLNTIGCLFAGHTWGNDSEILLINDTFIRFIVYYLLFLLTKICRKVHFFFYVADLLLKCMGIHNMTTTTKKTTVQGTVCVLLEWRCHIMYLILLCQMQ